MIILTVLFWFLDFDWNYLLVWFFFTIRNLLIFWSFLLLLREFCIIYLFIYLFWTVWGLLMLDVCEWLRITDSCWRILIANAWYLLMSDWGLMVIVDEWWFLMLYVDGHCWRMMVFNAWCLLMSDWGLMVIVDEWWFLMLGVCWWVIEDWWSLLTNDGF